MKNENGSLRDVIQNCKKVIHVNNLTEQEDPEITSRSESRVKLLTHLRSCREVYKPEELDQLNDRIGSYMTEKQQVMNKTTQISANLC
jgi:hypothetical protein